MKIRKLASEGKFTPSIVVNKFKESPEVGSEYLLPVDKDL